MAGILLSEGVTKGAAPSLEVLSIGSMYTTRQSSDLLPYLPAFMKFFAPLPKKAADMVLEVTKVPVGDLVCLTTTIIKRNHQAWNLKIRKEALSFAAQELEDLCASWMSAAWIEIDWRNRIKEVQLRDIMDLRARESLKAEKSQCLQCYKFVDHYAMCHDEWLIKENISQLRQMMSDQNLQLLPDYEQRIEVLKDLAFIDEHDRVELKGKVACEIHSADELVLTELILENALADFEPAEVVALLSAFVFKEKTDTEPTLTSSLEKGKETIISISEKVNAIQTHHQVILSSDDSNDFVSRPRFGLMEVVYEWARGMSFNRITDLTDVLEGTIVRVITRLDETCREVKNAARIVGDPQLFTKMQAAQEMIKRDIVSIASLYMG